MRSHMNAFAFLLRQMAKMQQNKMTRGDRIVKSIMASCGLWNFDAASVPRVLPPTEERMLSIGSRQSHFLAQSPSSFSEASAAKRLPLSTLAFGARACMFCPEGPMSLEPEVANGTTVLPLKS